MNYKKFIWLLAILVSAGVYGQTSVVTGKVSDAQGEPLLGVSVLLKGTTVGVQTDFDGAYSIEASRGSTLEFSYVGMATQNIKVTSNVINVRLQPDVQSLGEVVITALGETKTAKSLTYSVQKIPTQQLTVARDVNVMANLQGNVAGLQISPAATGLGGSMRLVLRGNRSLLGNNQPLIVYNGIIVNNAASAVSGFAGGLDLGSPMEDINAADIRDISVLKGGNSAALYGSLGYNGALVLVGNNGSGARKDGLGVSFSTNTYVQVPRVLFKTQHQYGQGLYSQAAGQTVGSYRYNESAGSSWGEAFSPDGLIALPNGDRVATPNAYFDSSQSLPYQDMGNGLADYYQTGVVTINNISLEKAGENYSVRASYGNTYNKYVLPGSKFDRNQFSINAKYDFAKFLRTETFVGITRQNTTNRNAGTEDQYNALKYFAVAPRSYSSAILREHYLNANGNGHADYGRTQNVNPYFTANNIVNFDTRNRFMASEQLEIDLYKDLTLKGVAGLDYLDTNAQRNYGINTFTPRPLGGLDVNTYTNWSYNLMAMLEYHKSIKDFDINANLGVMRYYSSNTVNSTSGTGFVIDFAPLLYSMGNAATRTSNQSNFITKNLLVSGFANLDVSYKDWAYLNATLRNDYTSTINKGYLYPSVSLSVLPSQIWEPLKAGGVFDYWKLRGSWAVLNNGGSPYQVETTNYVTPTPYLNGVSIVRYGGSFGDEFPGITYNAPNLRPEETTYYEAGLDVSLLQRRVYLSGTYFLMSSKDQIFRLNVPQSTGYTSRVVNAGEVRNEGVEVELKTTPVKTNNFSWNFDVNYTWYKSQVVSLASGLDRLGIDGGYNEAIGSYNIVGLPYGQLYGRDYLRNPEGQIYYDLSGLPIANPENQSLGNTTPDFTMGLRNTFTWKGLSLSVLLDWRQGGSLYSFTNSILDSSGNAERTVALRDQYNTVLGRGFDDYTQGVVIDRTQQNLANLAAGGRPVVDPNATQPVRVVDNVRDKGVEPSAYWGAYAGISRNYVYDASFMKLREVSLVYTFNADKLSAKTRGICRGLSIGYVGRNVATLFKHTPNIDPESSFTSGNAQGIEFFSVPIFATHGLKLTLDF